MASIPDALVPLVLRAMRANTTFVTAEGARRRVRDRALRPRPYGPPRRLRRDVVVSVRDEGGWPVYTVARAPGAPTAPSNHSAPTGAVVYVHGGGWVNEIAAQHWHLVAQIAAEVGAAVTVPIYPLVPFGTARGALDGVVALVEAAHAAHGSVSLVGDSAGGQIALSAALALRDRGVVLPATVLISPALDLTWSNPRIPEVQPSDPWLATPGGRVLAELWRGNLDLRDPVVSPLWGDFAGLGPLTLFSGTRDVLNPDAHLLAEKARAAGVDVAFAEGEGQVHVYPLLPTKAGIAARSAVLAALAAVEPQSRGTDTASHAASEKPA